MSRLGRPRFLWSVIVMLAIARASPGQTTRSCTTARADSAVTNSHWAPPLDRLVTLRSSSISLRDAIDRVASAAGLHVSYSAELLPLDRVQCANVRKLAAGLVFSELLAGTNVAAVGIGGDQVVLAPRPAAAAELMEPPMSSSIGVLDRVVVTRSAIGAASEGESTAATNVIDGRQLARENTNTLAGALDAYVPGVWAWAHSPSSMMSSYASIRGASSFGLSYPKIYIDGIEVANPLLVGRFNPGSIDHIEVIRGPQGSALYGTDAISGVVNIVTRHEGAGPDGSIASVRTLAGVSQSGYAHNVLAQDHELSLIAGSDTRSADLHVAGGSIGSFVPDGYSRDLMATGSARIVGERTTFSSTARLFVEQAGTPSSPLFTASGPPTASASRYFGSPTRGAPMQVGPMQGALGTTNASPQSVSEYTIGGSATTSPSDRWTHSVVAGIDGYRLSNVQTNLTPIPSIVDSALRAAEGGADRATLRATSELHFSAGERTRGTLTFAAEHSTLRVATTAETPGEFNEGWSAPSGLRIGMPSAAHDQPLTLWQNSTGLTGQTSVGWNDALFATGGVRLEHDSRLVATNQVEALPMLGVASVSQVGPLSVKLRAAYGEGIRPPTALSSTQLWQMRNNVSNQSPLGPERQSGIESGIDVSLRRALMFQITRFDQRASGLIQQVGIPVDDGTSRRMTYVAQNVGEISNRGWELQATSNVSHLAMTGALSFVDSRVEKLASGYSGDLVTGDRMLQVPRQTGSVSLAWTSDRWFASLGGSRALDWINYDELALAQAFTGENARAHDLTGLRLRDYWTHYDGGLHLRATTSHDIRDGFAVELTADNLLNYQRGEPDNLTIVPGRTIMTGIRVKF